jgi:8-oxo-dGTP diphosphatase
MTKADQPSEAPRNPLLTVDIIIECGGGIVLIERKNPPYGWALPGGFVDYGEMLEQAAIREAREETSLAVTLVEQMHTYSDPRRDPRHHTVSTVFIATAAGTPQGADDARRAALFQEHDLPAPVVFDHATILSDYFNYRSGRSRIEVFGCQRRKPSPLEKT